MTLDPVDVMCVIADCGVVGGPAAFEKLESALGTVRGRRFYATYLAGEYRACVALEVGDDPSALGLDTWRIPGGVYERFKLVDWQARVGEIGEILDRMAPPSERDDTRPSVEYYRSAKEIHLLRPVADFEEKLSRVLAERVEIVDYDSAWPALFDAECARLAAHFPPGSIRRIEHIGSTAVPGLAAKPIIDILVGVDDFGFVVDSVAPAMERAGYDYFFRPELDDDGPRYPWFIGRDASGARISHIHVALVGDASQWDRVVFRDYLRRHRDAALEYAKLKRELVARYAEDREAYTRAKTEFITDALARARLT